MVPYSILAIATLSTGSPRTTGTRPLRPRSSTKRAMRLRSPDEAGLAAGLRESAIICNRCVFCEYSLSLHHCARPSLDGPVRGREGGTGLRPGPGDLLSAQALGKTHAVGR